MRLTNKLTVASPGTEASVDDVRRRWRNPCITAGSRFPVMMETDPVPRPVAAVRARRRRTRVPLALALPLTLPVLLAVSCGQPTEELESAHLALDRVIAQRNELQRRLDVAVARAYHLEQQLEALRAQLGMPFERQAAHDLRGTAAESRRKRW